MKKTEIKDIIVLKIRNMKNYRTDQKYIQMWMKQTAKNQKSTIPLINLLTPSGFFPFHQV